MKNLIEENLNREINSFTFQLREGIFDKGLYNEFAKYVYDKNNDISISKEERLLISCEVWEIAFSILLSITCHKDKNDVFEIRGMEEEVEHSLVERIYLLANFMTYNKKLELTDIFV